VCVEVKTGTASHNDGGLRVTVNDAVVSSGSDSKIYTKGEVVVRKCFYSITSIKVSNPGKNAWTGSLLGSSDGGMTYSPLKCENCDGGDLGSKVVFDSDSTGAAQARTQCLNGKVCRFVLQVGTKMQFLGNDAHVNGKLQNCQGDCDEDSHCADGLKCFQRDKGEAIPGCIVPDPDPEKKRDFCYKPAVKPTWKKTSGK